MLNYAPSTATAEDYARIFAAEFAVEYPMVDAYEQRKGVSVPFFQLVEAARVLSCPLKAAPPNWQHGRVIYATFHRYALDSLQGGDIHALDIGTAKGFSALCAYRAIHDAGRVPSVASVDVMPPLACVRRNTPAEVDGLKNLHQILEPFPEAAAIGFFESTGIDWLKRHKERLHLAFVDGKHAGDVVVKEGKMIADRQQSGDITIFDDVQIPGLRQAVSMLDCYSFEFLEVLPGKREYAIGVKR